MLSTIFPYVAILVSIGALGVSFVGMQFALRNKRDEREYRNILLALTELEDLHEALAASHKRLRSRVGMRELRERRKNGDNPPNIDAGDPEGRTVNDPDEWKRRKRIELATGKLKPR